MRAPPPNTDALSRDYLVDHCSYKEQEGED